MNTTNNLQANTLIKYWLEKKKLWLGLVLGVALFNLCVVLLDFVFAVDQSSIDTGGPLAPLLKISLGIETALTFVYYFYRLFYLYKDIDKRKFWTALTIIGCLLSILASYVSIIPENIASGVDILGSVILLCCLFYDIILVFL